MKPKVQCHQCGKPLPEGAEEGNCPICLLEWGLGTFPEESPAALAGSEVIPLEAPPLAPAESSGWPHYFGDYELLKEIARGGMGVVYRARQISLNRTVAVKMILAAQFAGYDSVLRFQNEARAVARLRHPHIVGVHEVGEHQGFHYFSMDYIEGENLGQIIREKSVSPQGAAEWMKMIAEAIHYAHEQGILHRDLKPSNILIDRAGRPHVTDFGLAKQLESHSDITVSGQILGSPNYIPPEQVSMRRGQNARTSDVYSLGAVLYHLLAGRPPFMGENAAATMHAVLHQEVIATRLMNPDTPPDLETICLKCLEKEPRRRYQTAQELADELGRFLRDEPILAHPIGRSEKAWRWCRRKPVVAALAASLVIVFVAGLAGALAQLRMAQNKSQEIHQQVVRLNVLTGVQLMQAGDYFKSLLWFAEALATDRGAPQREAIHHMRFNAVLAQCPRLVQVISHDGLPIAAASFSPIDDRLATVGEDRTVRVWEIPTGRLLMKTHPFDALPYSVTFSPDGSRLVVVLLDNTAQLLDSATGTAARAPLPHQLNGAWNSLLSTVFDPTGTKLVTQLKDKELQIWDTRTGRPIGQRLVHTNPIERAQFNTDGSRLFTRAQGNFVWDTRTSQPAPFPADGLQANEDFFFNPRSNTALIRGRIWRWPASETRSSRREETKSQIENPISEIGQNLVSPAATQVGEPLIVPELLIWAEFSPSGDRLITTSFDRTAQIWDAGTAKSLTTTLPHDQIVLSAAFSPNARWVLTESQDNLRRVWDAETGQPLTPPISHNVGARASTFSGSGRYFLTMHPDFLVCVWDLHQEAAGTIPLRPLGGTGLNVAGPRAGVSVSHELNNLIRVRSTLNGLDVPLHPISMKIVPMQAWLDETGRFVILEGEMAKAQIWDAASGMPMTPLVQGHYSLDKQSCETVKLPSSVLSGPEAIELAQILSGSRLDGTGGWTPLKLEEITAAWRHLTRQSAVRDPQFAIEGARRDAAEPNRSSDIVGPSTVALDAWHEQEAKAAARALDWFAAAFHWQQLARLHSNNPRFAQLSSYAEQCLARARAAAQSYPELRRVIPPRDPRADVRLIDLSDLYTAPITEGFPAGLQTLGGVNFDVRGQIELMGLESEGRGARRPEKLSRIKVQQRWTRLHLLHTGGRPFLPEGEQIATLLVVYANGQVESIALQNRVQVSGCWSAPQLAPTQADVVWIGTNPFANSLQQSVWIYKYTWSNPHPDWEVSHVDLVPAKTQGSYILMAMTVE